MMASGLQTVSRQAGQAEGKTSHTDTRTDRCTSKHADRQADAEEEKSALGKGERGVCFVT